jgi:hypothetical protein
MNAAIAPASRPWYREPLVWLVAAIPALTVVAGLSTVVIAARSADDVVRDDFRKEGIAINRDPARDDAAAKLGVTARVSDADGALTCAWRWTRRTRRARWSRSCRTRPARSTTAC